MNMMDLNFMGFYSKCSIDSESLKDLDIKSVFKTWKVDYVIYMLG